MLTEKLKLVYLQDMHRDELARPHDCLVEVFDGGPYTHEQVKKLLLIIPDDVFAEGIRWSFSDTVVGDEVYVFIRDNQELVKTHLFLT